MPHLSFATPLVDITLFEDDGAIVVLEWGMAPDGRETPLLVEARRQIEDYFDGTRERFELPLDLRGTPFQKRAWEAIRRIPYGRTRSYGDLASELNSGPRAVAGACARNHMAILIPCHRVVGFGGTLGGYSGYGGLETKRKLLALEGVSAFGNSVRHLS